MMQTYSIRNPELAYFLERQRTSGPQPQEIDLSGLFCGILERANQFVPSEAGSIFIDGPTTDEGKESAKRKKLGELVLVACFGPGSDSLAGLRIPANRGIVGKVYQSGRPYISTNLGTDEFFYASVDTESGFHSRSVLGVPLSLRGSVIGVLELLNHTGEGAYDQNDLDLIKIFAQAISASLDYAVEAQRSKEMARRDDLTGLYNDRNMHRCLTHEIGIAIENHTDCSLIFLDLDGFKGINDVHGHLVGSRVLTEIGGILRQVVPGSAISARYGGDEFLIILPESGQQEAYWVAETVRKSIEVHVFLNVADPVDPLNYPALRIGGAITCSLGLASLETDMDSAEVRRKNDRLGAKNELMRLADKRMYRAKELGKNQICRED